MSRFLSSAGHEVLQCHEPGSEVFPCVGLTGACPLDTDEGIDVAVAVRAPGDAEPQATESGVTCSLRAGIPVVAVSNGTHDPFASWVYEPPPGADISEACESAVRIDRSCKTVPAQRAVRSLLDRNGFVDADTSVALQRTGRRLRLEVKVPAEVPVELDSAIATRVHAAHRTSAADDHSSTVDVAVVRPSG